MLVALVIQHVQCIAVSSAAYLTLQHFSTSSQTARVSEKKVTEHKMCVLIFATNLSESIFNLRRIHRDMIISLHVKYPLFLSRLMIFEFSQQSTEIHSNIKFHRHRPVGAELFRADGQTDITKLIVAFEIFRMRLKQMERIIQKTLRQCK